MCELYECNFIRNQAGVSGGSISSQRTSLTIVGCSFTGSTAGQEEFRFSDNSKNYLPQWGNYPGLGMRGGGAIFMFGYCPERDSASVNTYLYTESNTFKFNFANNGFSFNRGTGNSVMASKNVHWESYDDTFVSEDSSNEFIVDGEHLLFKPIFTKPTEEVIGSISTRTNELTIKKQLSTGREKIESVPSPTTMVYQATPITQLPYQTTSKWSTFKKSTSIIPVDPFFSKYSYRTHIPRTPAPTPAQTPSPTIDKEKYTESVMYTETRVATVSETSVFVKETEISTTINGVVTHTKITNEYIVVTVPSYYLSEISYLTYIQIALLEDDTVKPTTSTTTIIVVAVVVGFILLVTACVIVYIFRSRFFGNGENSSADNLDGDDDIEGATTIRKMQLSKYTSQTTTNEEPNQEQPQKQGEENLDNKTPEVPDPQPEQNDAEENFVNQIEL